MLEEDWDDYNPRDYEDIEPYCEHEYYSDCCGAPMGELAELGLCQQCKEHTVFTCECGVEYNANHIVSNLPTNSHPQCICRGCAVRVGA